MKRSRATLFILFWFCFLSLPTLACEDDFLTRMRVQHLGLLCDLGDSTYVFEELAKTPEKALCALVRQLKPTAERIVRVQEWDNKLQATNQVWRMRALRFLTCGMVEFSAFTRMRPQKEAKESEQYWRFAGGADAVGKKPGEMVEVWFSHTRMSTATDYLAPVEAQKDIIRQWREWLVKNGTNAGCRPNATDYNQWWF